MGGAKAAQGPRRISVIIPAFNEESTVGQVIRAVLEAPIGRNHLEVLVVDDGSTDGTWERILEVQDARVRALRHQRNLGKGAAVRTALAHATGDVVLIQDADLEYNPRDYPRLLEPILQGRADAVYGSRFVGSEPHRVLYFWHYVGNRLITLLCNAFTNLNLSDVETCFKALRRDVLSQLRLRENGFGFEIEVTMKLAQLGCRIYEVGVSYWGRSYAEGKKVRWIHGVQAVWLICKYGLLGMMSRLFRRRASAAPIARDSTGSTQA
jgi:glycosyltransferase involved in cell wall biosynthesis